MPGLYTRVCALLVFPLHERLKGHATVAVRRALEESQWWPAERLAALQLDRLRSLLQHASQHVPYYRDLLAQHSIVPARLSSLQDLERMPFLTKQAIRANIDRLKSDAAEDLRRFNTGGLDRRTAGVLHRSPARSATTWPQSGVRRVGGASTSAIPRSWSGARRSSSVRRIACAALRDRLLRTRLLPAFEMSPANLDRLSLAIARGGPAMLFGYPSSLALIARHAERRAATHGRSGNQGRVRDSRAAVRRSAQAIARPSVVGSRTATAAAMRASSRTSARAAACTSRPRT